uniref:Uncharacterized protein n=1 Tax=Tanacetum cinerariifolium TaxID=118510 RepID=A0A699UG45_TANCI|nr:hypothetical protein [Tanacetum cinerariifolium]
MEIVIPEVGGIDDDIPLTIKDDNLREKLLNAHLLIANIEALKDNPTQSSELLTKSSSTSLNSLLEETNTFHNSLPEFENFYFDLEILVVAVPLLILIYLFRIMKLSLSITIILKRSVVVVPLLSLISLVLNMIRLSLTLLMRSSPMNSLTSYLLWSMIVSILGICPIRVS